MILQPDSETIRHNDHRLVGKAHPLGQRRPVSANQVAGFVNGEADAVAGAVRQAGQAIIGAEAGGFQYSARGLVDRLAGHAGAHRIECGLLRGKERGSNFTWQER